MKKHQNLTFKRCSKVDLKEVNRLAWIIWPSAFKDILTMEQIDYMLKWMYDMDKLNQQFEKGHVFFLAKQLHENVGFVGVEPNFPAEGKLRIHKIYLNPAHQGKRIGKWMMEQTEQFAKELNLKFLHLNVNRFNNAVTFYEKGGFKTIETEDIDIGNGFFMNDFVMEKRL